MHILSYIDNSTIAVEPLNKQVYLLQCWLLHPMLHQYLPRSYVWALFKRAVNLLWRIATLFETFQVFKPAFIGAWCPRTAFFSLQTTRETGVSCCWATQPASRNLFFTVSSWVFHTVLNLNVCVGSDGKYITVVEEKNVCVVLNVWGILFINYKMMFSKLPDV